MCGAACRSLRTPPAQGGARLTAAGRPLEAGKCDVGDVHGAQNRCIALHVVPGLLLGPRSELESKQARLQPDGRPEGRRPVVRLPAQVLVAAGVRAAHTHVAHVRLALAHQQRARQLHGRWVGQPAGAQRKQPGVLVVRSHDVAQPHVRGDAAHGEQPKVPVEVGREGGELGAGRALVVGTQHQAHQAGVRRVVGEHAGARAAGQPHQPVAQAAGAGGDVADDSVVQHRHHLQLGWSRGN